MPDRERSTTAERLFWALLMCCFGCGSRSALEVADAGADAPEDVRDAEPDVPIVDAWQDADPPACEAGGHWEPLSSVGSPTPRGMHGAVWTGSEMLVWGGWNGSASLDDGSSYQPGNDTWTALPRSPLSARRLFGSAWADGKWLIWGGNAGAVGNGARYDPERRRWTPIASAGAPEWHYGIRWRWTGSLAVFWGGFIAGGIQSPHGARYDPESDRWLATTGMEPGSGSPAAVWTGREYVVVGLNDTAAAYDPTRDTWRPISKSGAPLNRQLALAAWTGEEVIVWGQAVGTYRGPLGARYNPETDSWTPMSMLGAPEARGDGTGVWTGCRFVVWGGGRANVQTFGDGAEYDPETDTWSPLPEQGAPSTRSRHSSVLAGRQIIIWGGHQDDNTTALGDGARYVLGR